MKHVYGLTLVTLLLFVAKVYGQACPEGANVAQMCVPGTYSGERVLIDTASYDPAVSNCSCTFGTTSSVMKLVTYVAPNYPECNSAVRLYSSSGNSIRFQCLMSGTYLDTSVHNAGVATFERYGDTYDKNYCLMLEIAGRVGDTVTVTCSGYEPNAQNTSVPEIAENTTVTENNTVNIINNTNDSATNTPTDANSSVIDISTTDTLTTSPKSHGQSSSTVISTAHTFATTTLSHVDSLNTDVSTEGTLMHTRENLTETFPTEASTTIYPQESTTTIYSSKDQHLKSSITNIPQFKQDVTSTSSRLDGINDAIRETNKLTIKNDTVEPLTTDATLKVKETMPSDTVTAIVTGTVLFNGGGTNSSKTIQTIGAVPSEILLDQSQRNSFETTTNFKISPVTSDTYISSFKSNSPLSEVTISDRHSADVPGTTQPVDLSNLLVMEPSFSPGKSESIETKSNISYTGSTDFSIQFPYFEPFSSIQTQASSTNTEHLNITDTYDANVITDTIDVTRGNETNVINATLNMTTSTESSIFINSSDADIKDMIPDKITLLQEIPDSDRLSIRMASPDVQRTTADSAISSNDSTVNVLKTSPFTTKEVRFVIENTEPTDAVGNITIRSVATENTTDIMAQNLFMNNMSSIIDASYESKAMEGTYFGTHEGSPDITTKAIIGFHPNGTTPNFQAQENVSAAFVKSTPARIREYDSFTNAPSMFESTGITDVSNKFNKTESIELDKTIGKTTIGNKMSLNNIPTTPSPLDIIYMESTMQSTQASNASIYSEVNLAVPEVSPESKIVSTAIPDIMKDAGPDKNNSFETSTYKFSGQKTTDPATINGSPNITGAHNDVTSTDKVPDFQGSSQPVSPLVQKENTSVLEVLATEVTLPTLNETNTNYLSSVQRIPLSELNSTVTESTQRISTENLDPLFSMHRDNATLSEVNITESTSDVFNQVPFVKQDLPEVTTRVASPTLSVREADHLSFVHQDSVHKPEMNAIETPSGITTQKIDHLSFAHRGGVSLQDITATDVSPEITTQNINHVSFVHRESILLSDINVTEVPPLIATQDIDHVSFAHRESISLSDINATEVPPEIATQNIDHVSFGQRQNLSLSDINATEVTPEIATQNIDHVSFGQRQNLSLSEINATEVTPEIATQNIDHVSFSHRENEPLPGFNTTEFPQEMANGSFEHKSIAERRTTSLLNMNVTEDMGTAFTEQPSISAKTTNAYVTDAGIDQHNSLVSTETLPLNMYQETTEQVSIENMLMQTTQSASATKFSSGTEVYTDKVFTSDIMQPTTIPSPTQKVSYTDSMSKDTTTNNFLETQTATAHDIVTDIAEEMIVPQKIQHEEVMSQEKIPLEELMVQQKIPLEAAQPDTFVRSSTDLSPQLDVLTDIEKQIITEAKSSVTSKEVTFTTIPRGTEQSPTVVTEGVSKDVDRTKKKSHTKSPEVNEVTNHELDTTTRNEASPPNMFPPEPILPKRPSHIDNHLSIPTTPVQSFNIIEETVVVSDEANPNKDGTDTVGNSGMNVYFDTGRSKDAPFEMNNDTYIIVVGAIVGLVVLAVVIGIFCHNSRKTRSEKVNISGGGDPSSHQNQAFDSNAADAELGTGVTANGVDQSARLPEENGASNAIPEKEHNGNME